MILTFEPNHLIAIDRLAKDAAKRHPTRAYYHNWCISYRPNEDAFVVATNGAVLLAARAVAHDGASRVDPLDIPYRWLGGLRSHATQFQVDTERDELSRLRTAATLPLNRSLLPFPRNWRSLAGLSEDAERYTRGKHDEFIFDPSLLAPITAALSLGQDTPVYATIQFARNLYDPQIVTFSGTGNQMLLCRLMLVRK